MPDVAHGFQLHPGQESWTAVTEFLEELDANQTEWRVGSTLQVPRQRLAYWRRAYSAWEPLSSFVVADPETTRLDRAFEKRGRGRADYDYLAESDPSVNANRFVVNTLEAERNAGCSVLVSPWLLHGVSQTEHELSATIAFAEIAEREANGFPLLMGVEATEGVYGTSEARNAMINELVEGPELGVYLRMRITAPAGYMQYQRDQSLAGLRDVVRSLDANDRAVAMPQSGLMGWLMTAFGARSFGAGTSASLQRNLTPTNGGGGFPPLHWYFVPQLLGFVQAEEIESIAEIDGFEACACPFCDEELPETGARFDSELAGKHFLWWCGNLAAELDPDDPGETVRERVTDASAFAEAMNEEGVSLDPRSAPSHLPIWTRVLAG